MKILICGNTSNSILTFRKDLILTLSSRNHEVYVTCSDSTYKNQILNLGAQFHEIKFNNRSYNLFTFFRIIKQYQNLIRKLNVDLVFTYMLKPNLLATIAARRNKVKKVISLNEGRGDGFGDNTFLGKIVHLGSVLLHRISFKNINKLIVLNKSDYDFFLKKKIVNVNQIKLIPGVGINLKNFDYNKTLSTEHNVLMISRLIKSKGVLDFCKIAKIVKEIDPNITFTLIGAEQELKEKDLNYFIKNQYIKYLGHQMEVNKFINNSRIVLFPSFYKEGLPIALLESMAVGRCTISYENPGSIDVIENEHNGFLVKRHEIKSVAHLVIKLIYDDKRLNEIGINSRNTIQKYYEISKINKIFIKVIES